jgi:ABC-type Fe3+ transport system substrate-binding protein
MAGLNIGSTTMALLSQEEAEGILDWVESPEGQEAMAKAQREYDLSGSARLTLWSSTNQDGSHTQIPDEVMAKMKLP